MASVFKRTYKRPVPPGAELFTRKGKRFARWKAGGRTQTAPLDDAGAQVVLELKCWYIAYEAADGSRKTVRGYPDREASEAKGRALESQAARERMGLPAGDAEKAAAPIAEPLGEWLADLARAGCDPRYVYHLELFLDKLVEECKWPTLAAIRANSLEKWLADMKTKGRSARTLNQYVESARAFVNWCIARDYLDGDPLKPVKKTEAGRKARVRRALPLEDLQRFLAAAPDHRRFVYLTAALTGLRKNELRQLQWGDVVLDTPAPFLRLRGEATKARRGDSVDICPELVEELRRRRPSDWKAADPVFPFPMPTWDTFRRDLKRAKIPTHDEQQRVFDFHALRHQFGTMLAQQGVSIREAMLLMRHTDIRLTTKVYVDAGLLDTRGAVRKLPRLGVTENPAGAATGAATGRSGRRKSS